MVYHSLPMKLVIIKIRPDQKEKLEKMKVHPRQPLYEVLDRLLEKFEEAK